jgi:energy-coupling factor transporter ATP-binding protein EcfA2
MILNEKQQEGLSLLKQFTSSKSSKFFLIKGSAGTGKSTLINEFINWYQSAKGLYLDDIVVTAPTNKAVRVLRRMSNHDIDYKTLHSLLGLRYKIDEQGNEVFEKEKGVIPTIYTYGCIIVDEASMIDDFIFDELINQSADCKIIFVGDPAQIPPVNHFHSKPMLKDIQDKFGIESFHLTEIVRQAESNPIIKTSIAVRQGSFKRRIADDRLEDGTGVVQLDLKNKEMVYDLIKQSFCGTEFSNNPDYAKVIAWRNSTVDTFNNLIRSFIYYRGVNKVVVGEKLILNKPILEDKKVIMFVNDDLMVTKLDVVEDEFYGKPIKYYDCQVERLYETSGPFNIKILHEDSEKRYESILNSLKNIAISAPAKIKSKSWSSFYKFKEIFADVSYNYAITCHKSQGSTYTNAFVCYSDITVNPNIVEMQRILYTAVTRPSKTLYII